MPVPAAAPDSRPAPGRLSTRSAFAWRSRSTQHPGVVFLRTRRDSGADAPDPPSRLVLTRSMTARPAWRIRGGPVRTTVAGRATTTAAFTDRAACPPVTRALRDIRSGPKRSPGRDRSGPLLRPPGRCPVSQQHPGARSVRPKAAPTWPASLPWRAPRPAAPRSRTDAGSSTATFSNRYSCTAVGDDRDSCTTPADVGRDRAVRLQGTARGAAARAADAQGGRGGEGPGPAGATDSPADACHRPRAARGRCPGQPGGRRLAARSGRRPVLGSRPCPGSRPRQRFRCGSRLLSRLFPVQGLARGAAVDTVVRGGDRSVRKEPQRPAMTVTMMPVVGSAVSRTRWAWARCRARH